jgi:replication factor C subunit 2/4
MKTQQQFTEKYRPKILKNIVGNKFILQTLQFYSISNTTKIPNMILNGPPGCGKTTSILCLIRQKLKNDFHKGFLEINGSSERTCDIMRSTIEPFSRHHIKLPNDSQKFVLIDEADGIHIIAQQYLKYIIDNHAQNTCFILICNNVTKISNSLRATCTLLNYPKLNDDYIKKMLLHVIKSEELQYDNDDSIKSIILDTNGDMRNALNKLQAVYTCFGKITSQNVQKLISIPTWSTLNLLIKYCLISSPKSLDIINKLYQNGFSSSEILTGIYRVCAKYKFSNNQIRIKFLIQIGKVSHNITNIIDHKLQLQGMVSKLCILSKKKNKK